MEEHLKALEGVVARLETLTGAKQEGSPSKVTVAMVGNGWQWLWQWLTMVGNGCGNG